MGTLAGSWCLYCTTGLLQGLQVRDHVGALFIAEHIRIRRHAVAAGVDDGEYVRVCDFLAVLQRGTLIEPLEARPDFLFRRIRVMADRALVKYLFALGRVSGLLLSERPRPGQQQ